MKMNIDKIIEKNKSREFISQFIYHGHGRIYERLVKMKKEKRCEGCESDIDAIMEEIEHNIIDVIEVIKDDVNHELDRFEFPIIAIRKGMDIPAKEQLDEVKKSREDLRRRINIVIEKLRGNPNGNLNTETNKRRKKIIRLEGHIRRLSRVCDFDRRYSKLGPFSESHEKVEEMKNQVLQLKKELNELENGEQNG